MYVIFFQLFKNYSASRPSGESEENEEEVEHHIIWSFLCVVHWGQFGRAVEQDDPNGTVSERWKEKKTHNTHTNSGLMEKRKKKK